MNVGSWPTTAFVRLVAVELLNGVCSAGKACAIEFGKTLQRDLTRTGARIQTSMPEAAATGFRKAAGYAAWKEPPIIMKAAYLVDAALAGLDTGKFVTIPGLHDDMARNHWEADRCAHAPKFANAAPELRYGVPV